MTFQFIFRRGKEREIDPLKVSNRLLALACRFEDQITAWEDTPEVQEMNSHLKYSTADSP